MGGERQMEASPLILMVDDDAMIRECFRLYLSGCGYRVVEAQDGQAGIELFRHQRPDLVLLDIQMPGLNGIDVLKFFHTEAPDTPVVMVSGASDIGEAAAAINLGAWGYLCKPVVDLSVLRQTIDKELERAHLINENREYRKHLEELVALRTIQLEAAYAELEQNYVQVIRSLGRAAGVRDNNTGDHIIRVSKYSQLLAKASGLPEATTELLQFASLMHDIGKIGTPDRILFKSGELNEEERQEMQNHCEVGVSILEASTENSMGAYPPGASQEVKVSSDRESELLIMAKVIASCHHERWDGGGYPHGLKGEEIPIEARIVTLADIYDAVSTRRPYKDAFGEPICQRTIREEAGKALDPNLVELFFSNIDKILEIKETWAD
jgi:putative two-component system response regulator